jgi:hypothetical protein
MIMDVKRSNDVKRWDGQDWEGWKQQRSQRRKQEQAQGRKQQQAQRRKSRMISSQGTQKSKADDERRRRDGGITYLFACCGSEETLGGDVHLVECYAFDVLKK